MKNSISLVLVLMFLALIVATGTSCGPSTEIRDASLDETVTGSDWSEKDLEDITSFMLNSIKTSNVTKSVKYKTEKPAWILAKDIENATDEHIDTRVILEKIRTKLINQGFAEFIDDKALDDAFKQLKLQQTDLYDNTKAAKIGRLVGAKLLLRGRLTNIRKKDDRTDINSFIITLTIVEIETSKIVWEDNKTIRRLTKKSSSR